MYYQEAFYIEEIAGERRSIQENLKRKLDCLFQLNFHDATFSIKYVYMYIYSGRDYENTLPITLQIFAFLS